MITALVHPIEKFVRSERLPHIWCSGCGMGMIFNAFAKAIEELNIDPKKVVIVSGIGCSGRASGYWAYDGFHTTHGRPIPFAMGLKLARPDLHVVVISGDGDLLAIGGNHFIHAARRNVDILVILVNNFNYGMTGGQVGPTTPEGVRTTTTPYGNYTEPPFNAVWLAAASGAVYVARWTVYHLRNLTESIKTAFQMKGFRVIEVISTCPTDFGRRNALPDPLDNLRYLKENAVYVKNPDPREADIVWGKKFIIGEFVKIEGKESFDDRIRRLIEIAQKELRRSDLQ
ncbi:MAG: thiamine pyrophosphate-dependent enzyme [Candidatus Korarchaeota archaeon]|nr:thiamine pyrophosphate-dependent enzyme [Thermoproteota archaeon]MCR8462896.1 thiamine pyrophosphate-dependent enzyme [Thermoproteota archaeon]MCR8470368.1 thiamine pyrophosphate-dependent enzyme [Thermoproteota archaeon]MCR8472033.1 thiamine pyrophosphate-dependent enzyme [Thermoproteota archaeon]MCR8472956.1 thiamine pyrophosphate-dependent enzyme [Thermoproteota archaeon]